MKLAMILTGTILGCLFFSLLGMGVVDWWMSHREE